MNVHRGGSSGVSDALRADPRWHVYVAYDGAAWIEGPFATEDAACRHRDGLRARKGGNYYFRLVRRETPERDLVECVTCGQAATWCASDRDARNEPVDVCAFCGARL